jgi:hypothetical protein
MDTLGADPGTLHSVQTPAQEAGVSRRHLTRLFSVDRCTAHFLIHKLCPSTGAVFGGEAARRFLADPVAVAMPLWSVKPGRLGYRRW